MASRRAAAPVVSWSLAIVWLTACTLTSTLDGLSSGAPEDVDAGDAGDAGGAGDALSPPDAGADVGATSAYAREVALDEPVAWWRLGDKAGTSAHDEQGLRDGTFVGGVTLGEQGAIVGDPDTAAKLDGDGGCVRIANDVLAFTAKATFSLELWVKPTAIGGERRLASRRTGGAESGYRLFLNSTQMRFERWADGGSFGPSTSSLPAVNKWSHVITTYDGASTRLYLDGVLVDEGTSGVAIPNVTAFFVWGANSGCDASFLEGSIDELAVYDRALDPARIAAHLTAAGR